MLLHEKAIVLRCVDYGDSSQIATVFTENCGKKGIIAKGVKRKKAPYQGTLEISNYLSIVFYQKPAGQLAILKEWELLTHFPGLRQNLTHLFIACYCIEQVAELTEPDDANPKLFKLLRYALLKLGQNCPAQNLIVYWQWFCLKLLGLAPPLGRCLKCAQTIQGISFFSMTGESYCPSCRHYAKSDLVKLSGTALEKLRSLVNAPGERWQDIQLPDTEYRELFLAFRWYVRSILNKELRMTRYLPQGNHV